LDVVGSNLWCHTDKKSYYFYVWSLNPPHLSAKLDIN
jgi:hypothetical protein